MTSVQIVIPEVKECMDDFRITRLYGNVPPNLSGVFAHTFTAKSGIKVQVAGQIANMNCLFGDGTVILSTPSSDTFIYQGRWLESGEVIFERFMSDLCAIQEGELVYQQDTKQRYKILRGINGNQKFAVSADNTHVRVQGSKIEFPVVPYEDMRMLCLDGEYVEINSELCLTEEDEKNPPFEELGISIHRVTRTLLAWNSKAEAVKGSLNVSRSAQQIVWNALSPDSNFEEDIDIELDKFRAWFIADDCEHKEERNLLRALGVKPPLLPEKKVVLPEMASLSLVS